MRGRVADPANKPSRERDANRSTVPTTELEPDAKVKAPPLPAARSRHARTKRWYRTWAGSPQAAQFLDTDWERLHMLADLVDEFFRAEDAKSKRELMAEIRLQEAKLGATPEDRLRLRWRLRENERADDAAAKQQEGSRRSPSRKRADPRGLTLVSGGAS